MAEIIERLRFWLPVRWVRAYDEKQRKRMFDREDEEARLIELRRV